MDNRTEQYSLRELLESITENIKTKRLADVFRFISFHPGEMYGSHQHLRIEINYVKREAAFSIRIMRVSLFVKEKL